MIVKLKIQVKVQLLQQQECLRQALYPPTNRYLPVGIVITSSDRECLLQRVDMKLPNSEDSE